MRRLVVPLLVLAVVLLAVDRVGDAVAERAVAAQLESSGELSVRPAVSIEGFPFLTQALSGRYSSIRVQASDVVAGGERLADFDASLDGVRLPLSSVLSGSVTRVPVDAVAARVVLSYTELEQRLRQRRLTLAPAGSLLRVTGTVRVLGRPVTASALSTVTVSGAAVVVTARRFEVGGRPASAGVAAGLGKRLDFRASLRELPYGLRLTDVAVEAGGVRVRASAVDTVLTR